MKGGDILRKSFGVISVLLASLFIIPAVYAQPIEVIPIGQTVGIRLYTDGLLVIGSSEVNGKSIAKKYDIQVNDHIKKINGQNIDSTEEFSQIVNEHPDGVRLSVMRDGKNIEIDAVPEKDEDIYRLGLWVRDSTAGIGTVTYYNPQTKEFAALGHSINDVDTGNILPVKSGNILHCNILSVKKSERGLPGEINGSFDGETIGDIQINSDIGIFGTMTCSDFDNSEGAIPIAAKDQVETGEAYIVSDAFENENNKYTIKIEKITNSLDKGLIIEITDQRLKDMAGGIVQGMSGSPIIQNGMLIGAVTHVFVNSPFKGYGTLAENMIDLQQNNSF